MNILTNTTIELSMGNHCLFCRRTAQFHICDSCYQRNVIDHSCRGLRPLELEVVEKERQARICAENNPSEY
jgi:hypothetical protein